MPKVLDLARKRATTFVEFTHGNPPNNFERYTDADQDTTFESNVYTSQPTMKVKLPAYTGMLQEGNVEITLASDTFTDAISSGAAHAPVDVRVVVALESDTPGTPVDDVQEIFKGQMAITVRNPEGKAGQVKIKCVTWKLESDRPCGLQANSQCYWQFQGKGCMVDSPPGSGTWISAVTPTTPATRSVTVSTIVQDVLTTTAAPPGGPFTDNIFHRGFLEFDGLKIGIREWAFGSPTQFLLERPAPPSWAGQALTLHQGCDKSILTCENRYANGDFFGGFGVGIRDYNPVFEVRD